MTAVNSPPPAGPQRFGIRAWGLLLVLCGAIFLEGIDVSSLAVAIPSIREDLALSTAQASWVISSYVLGYAGFVLLGGRAADLLGRRRVFLGFMVVFVVFSGLGGIATEAWMLIVARFATGVAAAFMAPAGLSIITTSFAEGPQRNRAVMIYATTSGAGFTLGLVAGGLLTAISWRWVFFAPVVVSVLILIAAIRMIEKTAPPERSPHGFDLPGAATAAGAMLLLILGVVRLEHPGRGWGWTAAAFVGGLVLLALFVAVERRGSAPLVRLGILRSAVLVRANVGVLLFFGAFLGFQFLLTLYLQEVRGFSPLQTGLALLAAGVDVLVAPVLTPRLVRRFGINRVIFGGFLLATASYALFVPALDWSYAVMLPLLLLTGLAFALALSTLTIAATDGVADAEQGLASGLFYTSSQFGGALGLSLATAALGLAGAAGSGAGAVADTADYRLALLAPALLVVIGAVVFATGLRHVPQPTPSNKPVPVAL
jgi:MFS family permease